MKLKIYIFSVFIIVVETIPSQIEIDNQSLDDHSDLEFEWGIISEFMKDQHGVTIFVEKGFEDVGDKILKYPHNIDQFGVYRYNSITLLSQFWLSYRQYTVLTNRIYGGILVMDNLDMMDTVIEASTNNKLVLVLMDVNIENIKKFMFDIWKRRKTFEIVIVSINTTGQNKIVQLNPFESQFYEYSINSGDSSKTIVDLINVRFRLFLTNMAGYEIKVFIFEFPLVSVLVRNSSGNVIDYSSVEGTLLKLCKQFMNFTPVFVDVLNDPRIFSTLDSINIIENGLAELGVNNRPIQDVTYNNTVFLYPTDKLAMCFVVPINYEEIPLKILTYDCFDIKSRILITISICILSAIWMLGRHLIKQNVETATNTIPWTVIALLHNVPTPNPKLVFNQIVFITITFFSLLLTSVYQGTVVEQLNNPLMPHQLDTLKNLYKSNLILTELAAGYHRDEKTNITIKGITQFETMKEGLDMVAYNKTTAFLMPITFYPRYSVTYFNFTTGLDLLHIINEPSTSSLISYVAARNSPYIRVFNQVVRYSIECGILNHERTMAEYGQYLYYIRRIRSGYVPMEKNHFRPIQLADLNYLQIFVFTNWTLGVIVFLLEHVVCSMVKFKQKVNRLDGEAV